MFKLQLIKGRSYVTKNIRATIQKPLVEVDSKELADYLVSCGHFKLIGEDQSQAATVPAAPTGTPDVAPVAPAVTTDAVPTTGTKDKAKGKTKDAKGEVDFGEE